MVFSVWYIWWCLQIRIFPVVVVFVDNKDSTLSFGCFSSISSFCNHFYFNRIEGLSRKLFYICCFFYVSVVQHLFLWAMENNFLPSSFAFISFNWLILLILQWICLLIIFVFNWFSFFNDWCAKKMQSIVQSSMKNLFN